MLGRPDDAPLLVRRLLLQDILPARQIIQQAVDPSTGREETSHDAKGRLRHGIARIRVHARRRDGERADAVDTPVTAHVDHHTLDLLGILPVRTPVKAILIEDKGETAVDEKGEKLDDEDPDIVEGEAFSLVVGRDPALPMLISETDARLQIDAYPTTGAREESTSVTSRPRDGQNNGKEPDARDDSTEPHLRNRPAHDELPSGPDRNGEHEESVGNVAKVDECPLCGAQIGGCEYCAIVDPVQVKQKS